MAKKRPDITLPNFYIDPSYQKSQDVLLPFGSDVLQGKLPDFYSSLGKTNTPEFNEMLSLVNRDTAKAVNENIVRRNISRSGIGLSTIAKTAADVGSKLRWEDFMRGNQEKMSLLGLGTSTLEGVRSAGLSLGGQKNQYQVQGAQLALEQEKMKQQKEAANNAMWSQILSSAIGAAGMLATGGLSGIAGFAGAAGSMGAAGGVTGGFSSFGSESINFGGGAASLPLGFGS